MISDNGDDDDGSGGCTDDGDDDVDDDGGSDVDDNNKNNDKYDDDDNNIKNKNLETGHQIAGTYRYDYNSLAWFEVLQFQGYHMLRGQTSISWFYNYFQKKLLLDSCLHDFHNQLLVNFYSWR